MGQQLSQSIGIGLAAVLLRLFMAQSHATRLTAGVIAPVYLTIGGIALISTLFFVALPADAGAGLHGLPRPLRNRGARA